MKHIKAEISHGDYSKEYYASGETATAALQILIVEAGNNYLPALGSTGFAKVAAGLERGERTGHGWVWFDVVKVPSALLPGARFFN